jgi:hypothetical protein
VVRAGDLEIGVIVLPLPLDHEDEVVGVEVARRLEGAGVVPLHALAQAEGVGQAVRRDVPFLGERRLDLGAAALELHDGVVDLGVGIEGGAGRVDARREILGAAFRAIDQGLGHQRLRRHQGRRRERCQQNFLHDRFPSSAITRQAGFQLRRWT